MKQTRRGSLIEACTNTIVGFGLSVAVNFAALPLWGLYPTATDAFGIGLLFTIVSVIRGYVLRRGFEILRLNGVVR